ncbi:hypothetical protein B0A58_06760 [Flavobacterium branchiophilum NBRC 15030 = ATCC 35035]|uniref:Glycerophosphoryl diester phosphodiesterase membrane domain-containing protein n=1 Tax=Flavobacterium branchiophilum TaxID=55197 RepID=A0A543G7X7_9FLAO|nr:hypothetical protein [Flavobacterium branchiophilum]OXA76953.1 hypothetical protein B0A58_06760 [Flavobacterium branchiophilum NBRC 15030 = ATCC 35035]TQM42187.1 hypothetical protein BC670_3223 [Flavobacterium branchiophilum]GEM54518.1 hypothetical protein FB1_07390 [Flavobacterium branchiophilum NBRC 15030 = ATCC 35035]
MFQLYKKRNFNDYISDNISFFKIYGKNYFSNFIKINGIFIIILVFTLYFLSKFYMEIIMKSMNTGESPSVINDYFQNNAPLFFSVLAIFIILTLFLSIVNYTFPIIYLELLNQNNEKEISAKSIIKAIKEQTFKMIKFTLGIIFIIMPLGFILFGILILLCFIIIGIPLLFIMLPAFMSWISISYHEYIVDDCTFFESLNNALTTVRSQFWPIIGSTLTTIFLVQTIQGFITMIPYLITVVWMMFSLENIENNPKNDLFSIISIIFTVIIILSFLLSIIFQNFIFIQQSLIFYSHKEMNEAHNVTSQIDLIGTDFE